MKMAVFWVVAPCSLVEVYQHFRMLRLREMNYYNDGVMFALPRLFPGTTPGPLKYRLSNKQAISVISC
jgi:hypothetical protein